MTPFGVAAGKTARLAQLCLTGLLFALATAPHGFSELHELAVRALPPGQPVSGVTHAGAADVYRIEVPAGRSAHLSLHAPTHLKVELTDESNHALTDWQDETVFAIAPGDASAALRLVVRPGYTRQAAAAYRLALDGLLPATKSEAIGFQARLLHSTAMRLLAASDVQAAIQSESEALRLALTAPVPEDVLLATLGNDLGNMQIVFGAYAEATRNLEDALGRAKRVSAQNPQMAQALRLLGFASVYGEHFGHAEELLQQSLSMTKAIYGEHDPRVADVLHNMAIMRQRRGEAGRGLAAINEALAIDAAALDADDAAMITLLDAKADVYIDMGEESDRAEPILAELLPVAERQLGPDHILVAHMLQNLGIMARRHNRYDQALAFYWRAEKIRERRLGRRHMGTASLLINIGNVYKSQGDYAHALSCYLPALEVIQDRLGPYHEWAMVTVNNIANAYVGLGDIPHAVEYLARENEGIERTTAMNVVIGSERERLAYVQKYASLLDQVISLSLRVAPQDQASRDLAALVLLERKGRVQDELANSMQSLRGHLQAEDQGLLDQLRRTTAELARVTLGSPDITGDVRRAQISRLEEERERLEIRIAARSAGAFQPASLLTLGAVRSAIPSDAALVEFARYTPLDKNAETSDSSSPRYAAFLLTPGRPVVSVDLGQATVIDASIEAWRAALRDPARADVQRLARRLDRHAFEPVRALAPDVRRFLLSPDGQLNLVPMEALVSAANRYLVEDYSISYLTSGRDLLRLQATVPSRQQPVIVANPSFGLTDGLVMASASDATLQRRSITAAENLSEVYFAPLRGTAEEGQRIRGLFPEARLLSGGDASKSAMQELAGPRILHIATHGFFLDDSAQAAAAPSDSQRGIHVGLHVDNPLLRSGLALAGANVDSQERDNGVLTALEASSLDLLGTKLVTLSACDTGSGEVKNGEGTFGLRRAFVLAGAESIVTSLWSVSDYATRELMTSYYTGLQHGGGRSEALRQAKLAMLARRNRAHPYFWASFIQFGAWTSLGDR